MSFVDAGVTGFSLQRGRTKDFYELGNTMLVMVATDRLGVGDLAVSDKGRVGLSLSTYWSDYLEVHSHFISTNLTHMPNAFRRPDLEGRVALVECAQVFPHRCVVRGFLFGADWVDYEAGQVVGGTRLPGGLKLNSPFPDPLVTFSKVDQDVTYGQVEDELGEEVALEVEEQSADLYLRAARRAWNCGLILAEVTFEWGLLPHSDEEIVLCGDILTPDSAVYWPLESYGLDTSVPRLGPGQVYNWLNHHGEDVPQALLEYARSGYLEVYNKITGKSLED